MIEMDDDCGVLVITCDDCGDEDSYDGEFAMAWDQARAEGWRAYRRGREWRHSCQACVSEWAAEQ